MLPVDITLTCVCDRLKIMLPNKLAPDHSRYFRYPEQYKFLQKVAQDRVKKRRRINIGIVGVGDRFQEPMSVATTFAHQANGKKIRLSDLLKLKLFDFDPKSKEKLLDKDLGMQLFDPTKPITPPTYAKDGFKQLNGGPFVFRDRVVKTVEEGKTSLVTGLDISQASIPTATPLHVLMVNNVLQYTPQETRKETVARLADALPGGAVLIMHSDKGNPFSTARDFKDTALKGFTPIDEKVGIFQKPKSS